MCEVGPPCSVTMARQRAGSSTAASVGREVHGGEHERGTGARDAGHRPSTQLRDETVAHGGEVDHPGRQPVAAAAVDGGDCRDRLPHGALRAQAAVDDSGADGGGKFRVSGDRGGGGDDVAGRCAHPGGQLIESGGHRLGGRGDAARGRFALVGREWHAGARLLEGWRHDDQRTGGASRADAQWDRVGPLTSARPPIPVLRSWRAPRTRRPRAGAPSRPPSPHPARWRRSVSGRPGARRGWRARSGCWPRRDRRRSAGW